MAHRAVKHRNIHSWPSVLLAAVCLLTIAGCTTPHPVPLEMLPEDQESPVTGGPGWRVGDHWVYDDGYDLMVTNVTGELVRFSRQDEKNRWLERRGFLTVASLDGQQERRTLSVSPSPATLFPLTTGKSVIFTKRYLAGDEERLHRNVWLVEGKETITTPAGTYDCWVILFTVRSLLTDWQSLERWWYSPEVRHYVRMDYQYGSSPLTSRRLISFQPGQASYPEKIDHASPQTGARESNGISRNAGPNPDMNQTGSVVNAVPSWARALVEQWVQSWSSQDIAMNLSLYAKDFTPAGGLGYDQWRELRKTNLVSRNAIRVTVDDLRVRPLNQTLTEIRFTRTSETSKSRDQADKRWLVRQEADNHFIISEETFPLVVR